MGIGYTRQSTADIVDELDITAAPLNNEFNAIKDSFDGSSGHSHDGTLGEGPRIKLTSGVSGILPVDNGGTGSGSITGARANLLLTPGVDVQRFDAGLNSIAGLTTTANQMLYTTTIDTYGVTTLTPFARTFLDDVDAQAVRTTLQVPGLSNSNTWSGTLNNFTGNVISTATANDALWYFSRSGTGASGGSVGAVSGAIALTSDNTLPILFNVNGSERARIGTTGYSGNANITGGSVVGITDLTIADGGTGASTASAARTNLGFGALGTTGLALLASATADAAQTTLNLRGPTVSLGDDTIQTYAPSVFPGTLEGGILFVFAQNPAGGNGVFFFRTKNALGTIQLLAGNGVQAVVGSPTAGSATDNFLTVAVNPTDGVLRIINRNGNTYSYTFFYLPAGA